MSHEKERRSEEDRTGVQVIDELDPLEEWLLGLVTASGIDEPGGDVVGDAHDVLNIKLGLNTGAGVETR